VKGCYDWYPFETRCRSAAREPEGYMNEEGFRRLDIGIVTTVGECAETCVDDLLAKLAAHSSMTLLPPRRQALIERTTSALLRIVADESQTHDGEP
jgi:hypothetical protein